MGKKEEETKTYDKENVEVVSNKNEENNYNKANEAILQALNDEKWQSDNILPEYFSRDDNESKLLQRGSVIYYAKMSDVDGMPLYVVNVIEGSAASQNVRAVTYKDGKVVVSKKTAEGEYSYTLVDTSKNIIAITNDPTSQTSVYKIEDNEFVKVANCQLKGNDNIMYYYIGNEKVSSEKFEEYIQGCTEMTMKLSNSKIGNNLPTNDQTSTTNTETKGLNNNVEESNNNAKTYTNETKYKGEVSTVDSNTENPNFATTEYTVSMSDDKINEILAQVTYKAKDTATITIDDIQIVREEAAAGTSYTEFKFSGNTQNGHKVTGTGTYSYSNVVSNGEIGLKMKYNEDIFNGVNISNESRATLKIVK